MTIKTIMIAAMCALGVCAANAQSLSLGERPTLALSQGDVERGVAAWYGRKFAGRKTASGKRFDPDAMTAAHPSLPFGTRVRVTNVDNKRSVVLTINDRGPSTPGRIIDVSLAAAKKLDFVRAGLADVAIEVLE